MNYNQQRLAQNPQYNPDLQYDDYYDEELDEEEEALMYKQMMMGQRGDPVQAAEAVLGEGFEIMEEELDEDYEPTEPEIVEYAKYLGMDIRIDTDLFYIAKEGLKAPLPGPWKPCKSPGGNIYYFNFENQKLQKEHPCDDYYKKYYHTEKGNVRRKKEEKVIKKQIKQQQQIIQQSSLGNTLQNPNTQASGVNASIQQMMLMNMSGLDISSSHINERVQMELEQLMDDFEDEKILHERQKRDELKKLDQEKILSKQSIQDNAKQEDKRIRELRDLERQKVSKQEKIARDRADKAKQVQKKEEESRHELEANRIKDQYKKKSELEKERVHVENQQLIEESGDIDRQVMLFRSEFMDEKIDTQKDDIDEDYRNKVNQIKQENKLKLEKERARIEQELVERLEKEKEKENRKIKQKHQRVEDQKDDMKRENQQSIRDEKRNVDKVYGEKLRSQKQLQEAEMDKAKQDIKDQVYKQFEVKELRQEADFESKRAALKSQVDIHQQNQNKELELNKMNIEEDIKKQLERDKQVYLSSQNEKSESYQQITKDIQLLKHKVREIENQEKLLTKEVKAKKQGCEDLDIEKRSKERELKKGISTNEKDSYEMDLEEQLRAKQEELDRLRQMIKEKGAKQQQIGKLFNNQEGEEEESEQYKRLSREIDSVKLMLYELKPQKEGGKKVNYNLDIQRKPAKYFQSSVEEIRTMLEAELPRTKHKRENYDTERTLIRTLLSNIERNRTKLRKEHFDASNLSHQRRLAIQGIKEKIDDQARLFQEESQLLKDKCDYYRRKEDKLRMMHSQLEIVDKLDSLEQDKKDILMSDLYIDYDKYLKLYLKDQLDSKDNERSKQSKSAAKQVNMQAFSQKWSSHLVEEADQDLRPIIGLDPQRRLFQEHSLYNKYEISSSQFKSKLNTNHLYDNEIDRVRDSRYQMKNFLGDQQQWLSKLKSDLNKGSASKGGMVHIGSDQSLFQLKTNLSRVLQNY